MLMATPKLIAHRGYTRHYPENTASAIEASIAVGAIYVEVDIQLSRDRVPVLFHDRTLERLCAQSGAIHEYSLAQLKTFHVLDFSRFGYKFAQTPIPTLTGLVAMIVRNSQVTFFIELKRISLEEFGVEVMVNCVLEQLHAVKPQCVIISYAVEALAAVQQKGWPAVGVVIDGWRQRNDPAIEKLKPAYLFCDIESLPRWGRLHAGSSKLVVFECTNARQALQLAKRGVEFVETFAIGEMQTQCEALVQ